MIEVEEIYERLLKRVSARDALFFKELISAYPEFHELPQEEFLTRLSNLFLGKEVAKEEVKYFFDRDSIYLLPTLANFYLAIYLGSGYLTLTDEEPSVDPSYLVSKSSCLKEG